MKTAMSCIPAIKIPAKYKTGKVDTISEVTEKFFQCDKGDGRESVEILLFFVLRIRLWNRQDIDVEKSAASDSLYSADRNLKLFLFQTSGL